jgi:hypothetical protein
MPEVAQAQDTFKIETFGKKTALTYAVLLIPTVLLLIHSAQSGISISDLVSSAWKLPLLQSEGLSSKTLRIVADSTCFVMIALAGLWYVQGWWRFSTLRERDHWTAPRLKELLTWVAICGFFLVAVIPFHSRDLYGYINRGAQQVFYSLNPYLFTVSDIPDWQTDPMFHSHWVSNPCPYGFFFALLAKGLVALSFKHFWVAFLLFKTVSLGVHLGTTALVYRLSNQLKLPSPWLNAYLYGMSPLMLLHLVGNGHNDGLVALTLLGAFSLALGRRWHWASWPVLVVSILTKYLAVLAAPFLAVLVWRRYGLRAVFLGSALGVLMLAILAWPYVATVPGGLAGFPWERMQENATLAQHSFHSLVNRLVFYGGKLLPFLLGGQEAINWGVKVLLLGGFGLFYMGALWSYLRVGAERLAEDWVRWVGGVMVLLLVLVSPKFHGWYLGMVFPLVLLMAERGFLRRFVLGMTLVQLAGFTPLENLHIGNYLILTVAPLVWAWKTQGGQKERGFQGA